jgi:hypothetical protein
MLGDKATRLVSRLAIVGTPRPVSGCRMTTRCCRSSSRSCNNRYLSGTVNRSVTRGQGIGHTRHSDIASVRRVQGALPTFAFRRRRTAALTAGEPTLSRTFEFA